MKPKDSELLKNEEFWLFMEEWWKDLYDNRTFRAELRKAKTPEDVFVSPAFQRDFMKRLKLKFPDFTNSSKYFQLKMALAAGILSHADEITLEDTSFPVLISKIKTGNEETRDFKFRKLISIKDKDSVGLYMSLLRLVKHLKREKIPLKSFVQGIFWWNENTKRDWAFQYYSN